MMRTSTGSMSVMKIIQKKNMRSGKWKNATANADVIDIAILPTAITNPMIRLFSIIRLTGVVPLTRSPSPDVHALV